MPAIYRILSGTGNPIGEMHSIHGIIELLKGVQSGRYRIEVFSLDRITRDLRYWDWGGDTKSREGRITLDRLPWLDWCHQGRPPTSCPRQLPALTTSA